MTSGQIAPFRPDTSPAERRVQLAELRALALVLAGPHGKAAYAALTAAQRSPNDAVAVERAAAAFDQLAPKPRRQILSTYAALRRGVQDG